jgi:hypothetical protein
VLLSVILSALYFVVTIALASRKLMWNDELYTYYIARLPSMRDVWSALLAGGEQTPPFFYLTTRAAIDLAGDNNVAIRLPAMFGFWLMTVCVLTFVSRRTSWFPALCAAAFPLVTIAYYYAFEARAYGMVLGFSALATLAWQSLTMRRRRWPWLVCLAVSLSAAISSHYYGIFVILPLALGEATRSVVRRRLDVPAWIALAFPMVPLALHLPLLRSAEAYSGAFWAPPQWVNIPDFYLHLLSPALTPLVVLLVVAIVHAWSSSGERWLPADAGVANPPLAEMVVACGFIVIPFVTVVSAKVATGAFTDRYALPAVIGFALMTGFGTAVAFRRSPLMRAAALVCLVGWFGLSEARERIEPTGASMPVSQITIDRPAAWLRTGAEADLPVVIADPHTFTVLSHYGAADLRRRIVYLADPALALTYLGHNSVERGMLDLLKPWFHMNVVEFEPFVGEHSRFLVYGDFYRMSFLSWLTPELHRRGLRLELLNRQGDNLLLLVSRSG